MPRHECKNFLLFAPKTPVDDAPARELVSSRETATAMRRRKPLPPSCRLHWHRPPSFSAPQLPCLPNGRDYLFCQHHSTEAHVWSLNSSETTLHRDLLLPHSAMGMPLVNRGVGCGVLLALSNSYQAWLSLWVSQTPWKKVRQVLLDWWERVRWPRGSRPVASSVRSLVTPRTVAHQAPVSMGPPGKNPAVGSRSLQQGVFAVSCVSAGRLLASEPPSPLPAQGFLFTGFPPRPTQQRGPAARRDGARTTEASSLQGTRRRVPASWAGDSQEARLQPEAGGHGSDHIHWSPGAASPQGRLRCSWSELSRCACACSSWWSSARPSVYSHWGRSLQVPPVSPFY